MTSNDIDSHDNSKLPSDLHFSDSDEEDEDSSGLMQAGDYSSRMDEIMDDDEDEGDATFKSDSDGDDVFVYEGLDSTVQTVSQNYRDRLREALGGDDLVGEDDSENDDDDVPEETSAVKVVVDDEGSPVCIYVKNILHFMLI